MYVVHRGRDEEGDHLNVTGQSEYTHTQEIRVRTQGRYISAASVQSMFKAKTYVQRMFKAKTYVQRMFKANRT